MSGLVSRSSGSAAPGFRNVKYRHEEVNDQTGYTLAMGVAEIENGSKALQSSGRLVQLCRRNEEDGSAAGASGKLWCGALAGWPLLGKGGRWIGHPDTHKPSVVALFPKNEESVTMQTNIISRRQLSRMAVKRRDL